MSNYRRLYIPGGTVFLTVVTHHRRRYLEGPENVQHLRLALAWVQHRFPFEFRAGVVLADHLHFLWTLPPGDAAYSRRIGLMKVLFTRSLLGPQAGVEAATASRGKHRESEIWHRRFWEHTIKDGEDLEPFLHYIHFNPVKHGHLSCPHLWPYSSFSRWVRDGLYPPDWGCRCGGRSPVLPRLAAIDDRVGE